MLAADFVPVPLYWERDSDGAMHTTANLLAVDFFAVDETVDADHTLHLSLN